jgi:YesN/AraC family two-component response regulator
MSEIKKKEGFLGQRAIIIPPTILTSFCQRHPVVRQLYVTDIGYYPNAEHHHRIRPHGTEGNIIIYCVSGKGLARVQKQVYPVSTGEFVLLPAKKAHEYFTVENNPWTIYWIHFTGVSSQNIVNMMIKKMGSHLAPVSFHESRIQLFEEIYGNLEKGYSIDNLCYASLCLQYFLASCCFDTHYNHHLKTKDENESSIDLCIKLMQKNIHRTLTLDEIAAAVHLSSSHIGSLFKKKTGFTLIEYFNQLKTQKACQYLLFTDLRVNEIAARLGMDDPYYFTRMFTKIIGVSPVNYRIKRGD